MNGKIKLFDVLDVLSNLKKEYSQDLLSNNPDSVLKAKLYLGFIAGLTPLVTGTNFSTLSSLNLSDVISTIRYKALIKSLEEGKIKNTDSLSNSDIEKALSEDEKRIIQVCLTLSTPLYSEDLTELNKQICFKCLRDSLLFLSERKLLKEEYIDNSFYEFINKPVLQDKVTEAEELSEEFLNLNKALSYLGNAKDTYYSYFLSLFEDYFIGLKLDELLGNFNRAPLCFLSVIKSAIIFNKINGFSDSEKFKTSFLISSVTTMKSAGIGLEVRDRTSSVIKKLIIKKLRIKNYKEYLRTIKDYPCFFLFGKEDIQWKEELSKLLDSMSQDREVNKKTEEVFEALNNSITSLSSCLKEDEFSILVNFTGHFLLYSINQRLNQLSILGINKQKEAEASIDSIKRTLEI